MYRIHLFGYLLFVKWLWNLLNEDNNCSSDINCSFISLSFQFLMFLICYHGPILALLASEKGKKFDRLVTRTRIIKKVCGFVYLIVFFCNFSLFRNEPQSGQITVLSNDERCFLIFLQCPSLKFVLLLLVKVGSRLRQKHCLQLSRFPLQLCDVPLGPCRKKIVL